jgi:hypothetical protein
VGGSSYPLFAKILSWHSPEGTKGYVRTYLLHSMDLIVCWVTVRCGISYNNTIHIYNSKYYEDFSNNKFVHYIQ